MGTINSDVRLERNGRAGLQIAMAKCTCRGEFHLQGCCNTLCANVEVRRRSQTLQAANEGFEFQVADANRRGALQKGAGRRNWKEQLQRGVAR